MKVAIVGVTGAVGMEMVKVLEKRAFPVSKLFPLASEKGKIEKEFKLGINEINFLL